MIPQNQYVFAPFRLDPVNAQLWRGNEEILLRRNTLEVLSYLAQHPGRLVTKAQLLDAVWPGLAVGDTVIKYGEDIGRVVAAIRKGDHVHTHNLKTKRW